MNEPIALCSGDRFCVVLDWVKLLCAVDKVVLRQDACNSLIAGIGFQNGLKRANELRKYRGG